MKNLKKVLAVVLSILFAAAIFAGCTAKENNETNTNNNTESSQNKVAILQYMPHTSLDNCTQGVKNALDEAGIKYDVQIGSSGSADADCQSYAQQMVASGYDLIIAVATPAAMSAYSAVQNASAGKPVVFCAVSLYNGLRSGCMYLFSPVMQNSKLLQLPDHRIKFLINPDPFVSHRYSINCSCYWIRHLHNYGLN